MIVRNSFVAGSLFLLLLIPKSCTCEEMNVSTGYLYKKSEADLLAFPMNVAFLAAEFWLICATGCGMDVFAPELVKGGPPPIGGQMVNLDPLTKNVTLQYGLLAIGVLRATKDVVEVFPRPFLNITKQVFAEIMDQSFEQTLEPPFDPYASTLNYQIASYIISLDGPNLYPEIIPVLQKTKFKELASGIEGVAFGVKNSIRSYLYECRDMLVPPYNVCVAEFTNRISERANKLGKEGIKSEGLVVPKSLGADRRVSGNVIEADKNSLSYRKSPEEVLRIQYGTGNQCVPGGFYPKGANGRIAKYYLNI
ncbi:hypothetical protein VNO78_22835 [Psophocarpus tetragonolobus]|uniref:Desiccation-related protein PCC13-62-like n=1 Tax=Psophocarpus tetragonolobus TaxID=3891 RepID=A0AAN9XDW6_PSOTE